MTDKLYYAVGLDVFKSRVTNPKTGGVTFAFRVCEVADDLGPEGAESVAEILAAGESIDQLRADLAEAEEEVAKFCRQRDDVMANYATLRADNERLREALQDLLMHCGIADAAPEDKDEIDHGYERAARAALAEGGAS